VKLLIVCHDNIGDLVFTSSLLKPLYDIDASLTVAYWCKSYTADVACLLPGQPKVYAFIPESKVVKLLY